MSRGLGRALRVARLRLQSRRLHSTLTVSSHCVRGRVSPLARKAGSRLVCGRHSGQRHKGRSTMRRVHIDTSPHFGLSLTLAFRVEVQPLGGDHSLGVTNVWCSERGEPAARWPVQPTRHTAHTAHRPRPYDTLLTRRSAGSPLERLYGELAKPVTRYFLRSVGRNERWESNPRSQLGKGLSRLSLTSTFACSGRSEALSA